MQGKTEKRHERWAGLLAAALLLLVCATGFMVYFKLAAVTNPVISGQPRDIRLLLLKELNSDLIRAENYMFAYSLKEEDRVTGSLEHIRKKTEMRLQQLRRFPSGDKNYLRDLDTLNSVVKRRFAVMELMMATSNETRVNDAMEQVIDEVQLLASRKKNTTQKTVVYKPVARKSQASKPDPVASAQKTDEPAKKKGLFKRLSKKKKEGEKTAGGEKEPDPVAEAEEETELVPEVVVTKAAPSLNVNIINYELNQIRNDVVLAELRTNEGKLALEQRNNWLVARFTQLLQNIENREKKLLQSQAEAAKKAAEETNLLMVAFCIVSVLLIGLVTYLIVTLLHRIKRTNSELLVAKERSDQLTESKSRFLANMSHEIRTPLNVITGYADQLQHEREQSKQREMIGVIQRSAWHLADITNEILDLSRIDSGSIHLESIPVSVSEELAFMQQTFREKAAVGGNNLLIEPTATVPPFLLTDPLRLRQILFNLLGNALKFTENGTVRLSVSVVDQQPGRCTLCWKITDTGIGIAPEKIDRIFEEFEQADSATSRHFGGTGLGLTITRNLVQLMGGTIAAESEPGKGSAFTVILPFETTEAAPRQPVEAVKQSWENALSGKRILIVDDELYNRKLLLNMLKTTGAVFDEAEHGGEAVKLLTLHTYDLLLLDLRMPVMDGFQVLEVVRQSEQWSAIPVIALTAGMEAGEREHMRASGWTNVLQKPLKKEQLFGALAETFNLKTRLQVVDGDPTPLVPERTLPVDFTSLRELSGNDSRFYIDMLETFLKTTMEGMAAIRNALETANWLAMAEAAHKIAPPVRHMQGVTAYDLLKQMEHAGRTQVSASEAEQWLNELEREINGMLALVNEEISRTGEKIAG